MAAEKARYQGEPVAAVVAESPALAEDAAELVQVEYEALDPGRGRRGSAQGPKHSA